jgi:hypothetical protein
VSSFGRSVLRNAGLACVLVSLVCFAASSVSAAPGVFARIGTGLATALDRTVGHLFRPHGRHRAVLGEGPLEVAINGGIDAGVHRQTGSTTQSVSGASANLSISRRTERTSLTIEDPVTYTSGQSSAAQILVGYNTPSFGLTYGAVSSSQDSQIGVAGFARGLDLTLPRRRGTLDLVAASGTGSDGIGYHAVGLRRSLPLSPRAQVSLSLLHSVSNGGAEHATLGDLAVRRTGVSSDTIVEAAYGLASHVPGAAPGGRLAWSAQYDHAAKDSFYALYLRAVPDGFATIGAAQTGQMSLGANGSHRFRQGGMFSANVSRDRSIVGDAQTTSFRQTYQFTQPLKFGSVSATVERSSDASGSSSQRTTTYGIAASQNRGLTSFTETFQRAASAGAGDTVEAQSGFSVSRPMLGGQGTFFVSTVHSGSAEGASSVQNDLLGQYTRRLGRNATFVLTGNLEHALLNGDASRTLTLTTGVVRRISPSLSIEFDATRTQRTGAAGIASTANSVGVQVTGPFAVGGPQFTGKSNPKVPATIIGHVYLTDSAALYGGARNRGAANALVVLDGVRSQRTDAQGGYAFRLVSQGDHTIVIEPTTLGPGVVVDRENRTVHVLGGQVVNLDFFAGPFAAIGGRVFQSTSSGTVPLAGISVVVDKDIRTTTDSNGRYQIGRLTNGPHTVSVDEQSLPASAQLGTGGTRTVNVSQGSTTIVDWGTVALGSIRGVVRFAKDSGYSDEFVKDVYVVAQPGDHASITNESGEFLLAGLPPGSYSLSIDPETLPDGLVQAEGPTDPFVIKGGEDLESMAFRVGGKKKVSRVSFDGSRRVPLTVTLSPEVVPPGATMQILVQSSENISGETVKVESDLLPALSLVFDHSIGGFRGSVDVPTSLVAGEYSLRVVLEGQRKAVVEAGFKVDANLPLISVRITPRHPRPRQTVHVVAKMLTAASAGDRLTFEDGYAITLPKPRGQIFAFDVRIGNRGLPYHGTISTKSGKRISFAIEEL